LYYVFLVGELAVLILISEELVAHKTAINCPAVGRGRTSILSLSSRKMSQPPALAWGDVRKLRLQLSALVFAGLASVTLASAAVAQTASVLQNRSATFPVVSGPADTLAQHKKTQDEHCRAGTEALVFNPSLPRTRARLAAGEPLTIVALGSSTTSGAGATRTDRTYPAILEELLIAGLPNAKVRVVNQGIGSQRAEDMFNRIQNVLAEKPLIVVWQTGVNDAINHVGVDVMRSYLKKGIARIEGDNIDVLLMGAQLLSRPERYPHYDNYRVAMNEVAAENSVPVFSRYDAMVAWSKAGKLAPGDILGADGLHMVDASYRCLAVLVADGLLSALRPALSSR
jgi:acyl-CoA thioesterase I